MKDGRWHYHVREAETGNRTLHIEADSAYDARDKWVEHFQPKGSGRLDIACPRYYDSIIQLKWMALPEAKEE